jgi:hypothetical protein
MDLTKRAQIGKFPGRGSRSSAETPILIIASLRAEPDTHEKVKLVVTIVNSGGRDAINGRAELEANGRVLGSTPVGRVPSRASTAAVLTLPVTFIGRFKVRIILSDSLMDTYDGQMQRRARK